MQLHDDHACRRKPPATSIALVRSGQSFLITIKKRELRQEEGGRKVQAWVGHANAVLGWRGRVILA